MMKKQLRRLTFLIFVSLAFTFTSQAETQNNVLSAELLGKGFIYSLSYERHLTPQFSLGAGVSYWSADLLILEFQDAFILPLYGNYFFSPGAHRAVATFGIDLVFAKTRGGEVFQSFFGADNVGPFVPLSTVIGFVGIGYDYRHASGFFIRPQFYLFIRTEVAPFVGLASGWAF